LSAEKAADLLTMHSFELEGMEKAGEKFENVVVGKILQIEKHPNADKLQLTKVDTGEEKLKIVCGAKNISVGDKVPVALIGAKLPNGLEIKEAEIRGEKSYGMLCAKDELGLGSDHSGIYILEKNAKIGMAFSRYLKQDDTIFEIKVLPDRAHDCLSHVGVARELACLSGKKMEYDFSGIVLPKKKSKKLKVEIADKKLCPRYIGAVMENVQISESPIWMKARLSACGIKSINNVVDATNYVMLELGQPLHAFDAEMISGEDREKDKVVRIVVRRAEKNEKIVLLDESEMKLTQDDLLITNGKNPLALAGIMGGKNSGINEQTKNIVWKRPILTR
jgi:phenylalanyl-tRNA synthetase beta chain